MSLYYYCYCYYYNIRVSKRIHTNGGFLYFEIKLFTCNRVQTSSIIIKDTISIVYVHSHIYIYIRSCYNFYSIVQIVINIYINKYLGYRNKSV